MSLMPTQSHAQAAKHGRDETLLPSDAASTKAGQWWQRNMSRLGLRSKSGSEKNGTSQKNQQNQQKQPLVGMDIAHNAIEVIATTDRALRSTKERLAASLKQKNEALSPRVLRRTLTELQSVADKTVSEVEGGRRAKGVAQWYAKATAGQRRDMWLLMSEQFAPEANVIRAARERYDAALGTREEGAAETALRRALASPRRRLLQRFAAFPEGMRFLLDMRQEWLPELRQEPRLLALDAEMEALFSTWFDVAFLELRRISWDSPASLLEKLIRYEAVHDIKGWSDLKNRLDPDRRCYGFFHPRLPNEPLIFVEVALVGEMVGAITPLLDESASVDDPRKASCAIFYSISNTQVGLRGVGFGDSLIKRVVETLKAELPKLKTFATLSPIPGFRTWLHKHDAALYAQADTDLASAQDALLAQAAHYLARELKDSQPLDAVAKFHLGNGARVERLNWAADPSAKGLKQSFGLMVNYLYDLKQIDHHRQLLGKGKIACSAEVRKLMP
jgi:malonyl-CoA decarboxylase